MKDQLSHLDQQGQPTMVDVGGKSFVTMFVNGDPQPFQQNLRPHGYQATASTYIRYSDDNSNARSLDDQLAEAM